MTEQAGREVIEKLDWVKLRKGLFVFCRRRHGLSIDDADDVSQQALCRVFNKKLPGWDPHRYPTIQEWLGSIVNGLVSNRRRNVASASERLAGESMPEGNPEFHGGGVSNAPSPPDEAAITADRARKAVSRVLEMVAGDELAEGVVMQMVAGVDTARDQAEALQVDVAKIYRAREKVTAAAAQVSKILEE